MWGSGNLRFQPQLQSREPQRALEEWGRNPCRNLTSEATYIGTWNPCLGYQPQKLSKDINVIWQRPGRRQCGVWWALCMLSRHRETRTGVFRVFQLDSCLTVKCVRVSCRLLDIRGWRDDERFLISWHDISLVPHWSMGISWEEGVKLIGHLAYLETRSRKSWKTCCRILAERWRQNSLLYWKSWYTSTS